MSAPFRIFISYAKEDRQLAASISAVLADIYTDNEMDLRIDLMKDFRPGVQWRNEIDECLTEADLLLIVYTGQIKPSHSWTGYEVGFFSSELKKRPIRNNAKPIKREIIPISFLGVRGGVTENIEGIEFQPNEVTRPNIQMEHLAQRADTFKHEIQTEWSEETDQIYNLLYKISNNVETFNGRPTVNQVRTRRDEKLWQYTKELYEALHSHLRSRERDSIGLQNKLIVNIDGDPKEEDLEGHLSSVSLEFENGSEDVFNLTAALAAKGPDKKISWVEFQNEVLSKNDNQISSLWLANLKMLIKDSSNNQFSDNNLLLPSWDQKRMHRAIITRRILYYSGRVTLHIYLFEMFKRDEHGDSDTSLYSSAIMAGCRYKSLLLEPKSPFSPQWMEVHQNKRYRLEVIRLIRELDLIRQDSLQGGLNIGAGLSKIYDDPAGAKYVATAAPKWSNAEECLRVEAAKLIRSKDGQAFNDARRVFHFSLVTLCIETKEINDDYISRSLKKLEGRFEELAPKMNDAASAWKQQIGVAQH